jgi:1-acyl-sn-glycerol-3-phosphate acyltransferase
MNMSSTSWPAQSARRSAAWLRRARALVPARDALVFLTLPLLLPRLMKFAISRSTGHEARPPADDVRAVDPQFIGLMMDFFRAFGGVWFRPDISGVENVPAEGPALLVGNHSGGLVPVESYLTGLAIWDHFGGRRSMYSLVHDFVFEDPLLRSYALRLGMLRASGGSARCVFEQGHTLLVYPGSDLDTFRPYSQRGKVVLGGRKGFISLALRERVPIVPVVTAGSHDQFVVLTRGDWMARALKMHAWARTDVFPLVLSLPWGMTTGFLPYLPLPAQISIRFGEPIRWPGLGPEDAQNPEVLERCYREVEGRMQQMLDRLEEGRRFLLGRPAPTARTSLPPAAPAPDGGSRSPLRRRSPGDRTRASSTSSAG